MKLIPELHEYDFTCREEKHGLCRPHCVLCGELLAEESTKPLKFKRHLKTKHLSYKDKPVEVFKRKQRDLDPSQNMIKNVCTVQEQTLHASSKLTPPIAKCKKGPQCYRGFLSFPLQICHKSAEKSPMT